ncbi:hypothetical protein PARPLA_03294 [Rhodobacteraceae bacterium THAF1]|uniref:hypothetical protein n=1 Tax=Palleronia sp. THAF1 TaxID=2587842 RepID=UPI000F40F2DB|nr:hypothetical protein [Palleronia sp. THAF1]QFU10377.1 hypothetical protein FIU81_16970 [Palleronia sp. THAF1]VDC31407.1 hypothetical protein PARPLA_03294 [Rhodobacteraceae bacterium THAF1]
MSQIDPFLAALVFGAIIIFFFARDQFNRPTFERSRELARLIQLLTPLDMRNRMAFWRAYAFYAGILTLIYLILSAYGSLLAPLLPGFGEAFDITPVAGADFLPTAGVDAPPPMPVTGYSPDGIVSGGQPLSSDLGEVPLHSPSSPVVPLTISLAMVGLAPSIPILLRVEEKIRFAAHRLAGIPTRLISSSQYLRNVPLDLKRETGTALVPESDWDRIDAYMADAAGMLENPDAFREDMLKILSFRAWFLQYRLPTRNPSARAALAHIEQDLDRQIDKLVTDLDALILLDGQGTERTQATVSGAWVRHATEAATVAIDINVLYMLYAEHGIVSGDSTPQAISPSLNQSDAAVQKRHALSRLAAFVGAGSRHADREGMTAKVWLRATVAIAVLAFLFGAFFGLDSVRTARDSVSIVGESAIRLGLAYLVGSIISYALPLLVALGYQQAAYQNEAWHNAFDLHWSRWLFQHLGVAAMACAVAVLCHVGYNIYATAAAVGWATVFDRWDGVIYYAFLLDGPKAMRGTALSILTVLLIDAWRSKGAADRWFRWFPLVVAGVLCAVSVGVRAFIRSVTQAAAGRDFALAEAWPYLLDAGALAALIGFGAARMVRETLVHEYGDAEPDILHTQEAPA